MINPVKRGYKDSKSFSPSPSEGHQWNMPAATFVVISRYRGVPMAVISVIITSDSATYKEALESMLKKLPNVFKIMATTDLGMVVEKAASFQPDVILCALRNEGIPFSLLGEVKRVCPQTVIVLVTESYDLKKITGALEVGVDAYVGSMAPGYLTRILELVCRGGIMVFPSILKNHIKKILTNSDQAALRQVEVLTGREREIYNLLVKKYSNKEIARRLFISESTVKSHVRSIFRKIGVKNRSNLNADA